MHLPLPRLLPLVALPLLLACGGSPKPAAGPEDETAKAPETAEKWDSSSESAEAAKKPPTTNGAGAAVVQERAAKKESEYDKDATAVALNRATRQVKDNCGFATDSDGKATGPWGKFELKVLLGANGHMKTVTVPAPYAGKPVGSCVEKAFANLIFPPWSGDDKELPWSVEVTKPETKDAKDAKPKK